MYDSENIQNIELYFEKFEIQVWNNGTKLMKQIIVIIQIKQREIDKSFPT